ncbi:MAG: aldo/keto reductase [Phycisphaerae bacterium]|nr:aldo/keto reductase [Phycisphaerae bacterium]
MALNHYITLGRSGLRVSPLCLGTMTFGLDWGWGCDPAMSKRIMDAYFDKGGNFIDTANIYTQGHAEKIIGDHIGAVPHKRQRAVIATKFMGNMYSGDPNAGGAHRKAIYAQLEHSLRRLKTDYIDLYWMHFEDPHTPIEETMRTLDDLVHAGKIRYIGFSDTPAWKCVQAQMIANLRDWTPLIALQIEYSLLERTVEGALIPMALEMGLGVTPWSPLKGGMLSGKITRESIAAGDKPARGEWVTRHATDRAFAVVDALKSFAGQVNATPSQIAIAWVQSRLGVTSTIIGCRSLDQLNDNVKALDVRLLPEHMARLDELTKPTLHFPYEFLRNVRPVFQGGATINGEPSEPWPLAPRTDAERH